MRLIALAALCAALAAPAALASTSSTPLLGVDGPGFVITLKQSGKSVKTLKHGTYLFRISDKSGIHNFHLTGPGGFSKKTSVGATGTFNWTITLKKGTYKYVCDPHATIMHGSFTVT